MNPLDRALQDVESAATNENTLIKARPMIRGYHSKWWDHTLSTGHEVVEVEASRTVAFKAGLNTYHIGCITDTVLRDSEGKLYALEHKTASPDTQLHGGAPYWSRLELDFQLNLTHLIWGLLGEPLAYTIQDVIVKPRHLRKKMPKGSSARDFGTRWEIDNWRTYYGYTFPPKGVPIQDISGMESDVAAELRLQYEYTCDTGQDRYFKRSPRIYSDMDKLMRWAQDTLIPVLEASREGEPRPQNANHCTAYHSCCPFLGLCRGLSEEADFERKEDDKWQHVLTKSKAQTLLDCQRKFHYKYERRLDAEEKASYLEFGRVFHEAIEAYYLQIKENQQESLKNA